MLYSLELLVLGRREVARHFREARKRWLENYVTMKKLPTDEIARELGSEQMWFEQNCGGHHFGQEVMVWSAIATFYSTRYGWRPSRERFVRKLIEAFEKSHCSIEVKYEMQDAASTYHLAGEA